MFNGFWTSNFDFYWSLALQFSCITVRLSEGRVFFAGVLISFSKKWTSLVFCVDQLSSYFSLLKVLGHYELHFKNFIFRQDWVGRKVAGTKKTFFLPFLTQPRLIFWPLKAQIRDFLKSILVKKYINYIIINFVTSRLTIVKLLHIISFFANFDPNQAKHLAIRP